MFSVDFCERLMGYEWLRYGKFPFSSAVIFKWSEHLWEMGSPIYVNRILFGVEVLS